MVLGYHVTIGAYGFWLPNDPRGSGSDYVGAKQLLPFGRATRLDDRSRSVARQPHDWRLRLEAKKHLKYPPVHFTGIQAKAVGDGFGDYVRRNKVVVWACCILPDHAHLVIGRHAYNIESVVEQLKAAATRRLLKDGLHPLAEFRRPNGRPPSCWGRGSRHDFLNTSAKIRSKIVYVDDNPQKEGKPRQRWSFVVPIRISASRSAATRAERGERWQRSPRCARVAAEQILPEVKTAGRPSPSKGARPVPAG